VLSEVFGVSPEWSAHFLLIAARMTAAVVAAPLFGARNVPAQAKVGLAILLTLIVLPLHAQPSTPVPAHLLAFAAQLGSEVLVGLALGIAVSLAFHALEMAASMVSLQIGFGMGEVFDPITGGQSGSLQQFYRVLVTLVFFAINGHYLVIRSLLLTFEVVPAGTADLTVIAGERVVPFFAALLIAAVQVALPAFGALMLTDVALALISRSVPQLNALMVGFPLKIGVGLMALTASMPLMVAFMSRFLGRALVDVNRFVVP
jgi:flagellar biosynthetic protein FliR